MVGGVSVGVFFVFGWLGRGWWGERAHRPTPAYLTYPPPPKKPKGPTTTTNNLILYHVQGMRSKQAYGKKKRTINPHPHPAPLVSCHRHTPTDIRRVCVPFHPHTSTYSMRTHRGCGGRSRRGSTRASCPCQPSPAAPPPTPVVVGSVSGLFFGGGPGLRDAHGGAAPRV